MHHDPRSGSRGVKRGAVITGCAAPAPLCLAARPSGTTDGVSRFTPEPALSRADDGFRGICRPCYTQRMISQVSQPETFWTAKEGDIFQVNAVFLSHWEIFTKGSDRSGVSRARVDISSSLSTASRVLCSQLDDGISGSSNDPPVWVKSVIGRFS